LDNRTPIVMLICHLIDKIAGSDGVSMGNRTIMSLVSADDMLARSIATGVGM